MMGGAFMGCLMGMQIEGDDNMWKEIFEKTVTRSTETYDVPSFDATTIGASAFSGCKGIKSCMFTGATSIGASAFSGCSNLESVGDLGSCTTIGNNAFTDCSKCAFGNLNLQHCTSIGQTAFRTCNGLTGVNAPLVTIATDDVFRSCAYLSTIYMPNVTTLKTTSFNCTRCRTLTIGAVTGFAVACFHQIGQNLTLVDGYKTTINIGNTTSDVLTFLSRVTNTGINTSARFICPDGYVAYVSGSWQAFTS